MQVEPAGFVVVVLFLKQIRRTTTTRKPGARGGKKRESFISMTYGKFGVPRYANRGGKRVPRYTNTPRKGFPVIRMEGVKGSSLFDYGKCWVPRYTNADKCFTCIDLQRQGSPLYEYRVPRYANADKCLNLMDSWRQGSPLCEWQLRGSGKNGFLVIRIGAGGVGGVVIRARETTPERP
jgi:hypothetical protein